MSVTKIIRSLLQGRPSVNKTKSGRERRAISSSESAASNEFLLATWKGLRSQYFPGRADLDSYSVNWSGRRQRRVLASCNLLQRRVLVARELFQPSACRWINAVLYHELCHAAIGGDIAVKGGKRRWHGPQFRELERRHPDIEAMYAWIRAGGWAMTVQGFRVGRP
jgi:hypothetical protein